jgi:hypothetical protein
MNPYWELCHKKGYTFGPSSHILLSSSACVRQAAELGATPLNTPQFLCFQSVQAPKMIRELRHFLDRPKANSSAFLHHSRNESASSCGVGDSDCYIILGEQDYLLEKINILVLFNTQPWHTFFIKHCNYLVQRGEVVDMKVTEVQF